VDPADARWSAIAGQEALVPTAVAKRPLGAVDPRKVLRTMEIAANKAGVENVGTHTPRHSVAVAWLESGVHIKAVADVPGHSGIAITGDIGYACG
jgi:site-specific recombinase XerD